MGDDRGIRLDASTKARAAPTKAAAISWPLPADRRIDQLVALANEAGAATNRGELAAAIVAGTSPDSDELLNLVIGWRRALVRDVVVDVQPDADVIHFPRYGPGRRKRNTN